MKMKFDCEHRYADGFDLNVQFETAGLCSVLFGPSGSGKTTMLSMIAGILKPDRGSISIGEHVVFDSSASIDVAPQHRQVGVVFQQPRLFPNKTVSQNLQFGQRFRKAQKRTIEIDRVAEVLEISDLLTRYPADLSGGEKQRVSLGRALASGPQILLMDEPLSSLDSELKARILMFLDRAMNEWQIPTLFVTHSHSEARRIGHHVLLFDRGRLVAEGTPDELLTKTESLGSVDFQAPFNLLRVDKVSVKDGTKMAWVGDLQLTVNPQLNIAENMENLLIQFSPADVIISRNAVDRTSARNRFPGTICQLGTHGNSVMLAIDIGQIIWAVLTLQSFKELELEIGTQVDCLIKAHNVQVIS